MEIKNKKTIYKYLKINSVDKSNLFFEPEMKTTKQIIGFIDKINEDTIQLKLNQLPENVNGYVVFYSYVFIFKFYAKLLKGEGENCFLVSFPDKIVSNDRRLYPRYFIPFDGKQIEIDLSNEYGNFKTTISNISADGLAIKKSDDLNNIKIGDILNAQFSFSNFKVDTKIEILYETSFYYGCKMDNLSYEQKMQLNKLVDVEITNFTDKYLKWLERAEQSFK